MSVSLSQHSTSHIAAGAAASMLRLLYSDGHGRRPFALLFLNAAASVAVAGTQLSCSGGPETGQNNKRNGDRMRLQDMEIEQR